MAAIEVYRGAGDHPGEPIIEPMLSASMLRTRGTAEMDQHGQRYQAVEADVLFRESLRTGQLIALQDPTRGGERRAKLTGLSVRISDGMITCNLSLTDPERTP